MLIARLQSATPVAEVEEHYGWVREYTESLRAWGEQHALVEVTLSHVRVEGLFERVAFLHSGKTGEKPAIEAVERALGHFA